MLKLSEIWLYPVKSFGGISVHQASIDNHGLLYDRRWMLVDEQGVFLSQRSDARLALFEVFIEDDGFKIVFRPTEEFILIPFSVSDGEHIKVKIWDDSCEALSYTVHNQWFSTILERQVRLVYMPDRTQRRVDPTFAKQKETVGFADAYPYLIIGQTSLDDLNKKLKEPIPMNRFRPNFVYTDGLPFAEDSFDIFSLNGIRFQAVKPCARCVIPTINQRTAEQGIEPTATLAGYRKKEHKILFGQNLICLDTSGDIRVGDVLRIISTKSFSI